MANLLDRFEKEVVGSKGKIADYEPRISAKGDFSRVTDLNAILLSWRNILLTPLRSYDHDPEYGSELYKYIFDPADDDTADAIKSEVFYRLSSFDNRAKITSVNVEFLSNKKGFNVHVGVKYLGKEGSVTATIDEKSYLNFMER